MKNNKQKNTNQHRRSKAKPTASVLNLSRETLFESGIVKSMPQCTYYTGIYPKMPSILQVCITRGHPGVNNFRSFLLCGINPQTGFIHAAMIEFALDWEQFEGMLKQFHLEPFEDKMALERLIYDAHDRNIDLLNNFTVEFLPGLHILSYSKQEVQSAAKMAAFQDKAVTDNKDIGPSIEDVLSGLDPEQISVHHSGNVLVFSNIPLPDKMIDEMVDQFMHGLFDQAKTGNRSADSHHKKQGEHSNEQGNGQGNGQDGEKDDYSNNGVSESVAFYAPAPTDGYPAVELVQEADEEDAEEEQKQYNEAEETEKAEVKTEDKDEDEIELAVEAIIIDLLDETIGLSQISPDGEQIEDSLHPKEPLTVPNDTMQQTQEVNDTPEQSADCSLTPDKDQEQLPKGPQGAVNVIEGASIKDAFDKQTHNNEAFSKQTQSPSTSHSTPAEAYLTEDPYGLMEAQKRVQDKINKLLQYKIPAYNPAYCQHWNRDNWTHFLSQEFDKVGLKMLHDAELFTPLLFLLKNGLAPDMKANPAIMGELEYLETHPVLTTESPNFINNYLPSPDEVIQLATLREQFDATDNPLKHRTICKALEVIIDKFPSNPYLVEQLYHFHERMQDSQMSFRLACRLYNFSAEREGAVSRYFIEICKQNKFSLLDQFLGKSILIERHLPDSINVYNTHYYHQYYQALASYFSNANKWIEYLKLVEIFMAINTTKKDNLLTILWNTQYLQAADFMIDHLVLINNRPEAKKRLIDNICKNTSRENEPHE